MSSRPSISICLTALIFLSGCAKKVDAPAPIADNRPSITGGETSPISRLMKRRLANSTRANESMSLRQSHERMHSDVAVCPDRRLIEAVAYIHNLITDEARESVDVQFNGRSWIVSYKKQTVGELSELPEFREMYKLLVTWASKVARQSNSKTVTDNQNLAAKYSTIESQLIEMSPDSLFAALKKIEEQLKNDKGNAQLVKLAARARALLLLQSLDSLEINDSLSVSALAYVALYEGQFKQEATEECGLIADALAYHNAARNFASRLPASDAVCLYLRGEKKELEK